METNIKINWKKVTEGAKEEEYYEVISKIEAILKKYKVVKTHKITNTYCKP